MLSEIERAGPRPTLVCPLRRTGTHIAGIVADPIHGTYRFGGLDGCSVEMLRLARGGRLGEALKCSPAYRVRPMSARRPWAAMAHRSHVGMLQCPPGGQARHHSHQGWSAREDSCAS